MYKYMDLQKKIKRDATNRGKIMASRNDKFQCECGMVLSKSNRSRHETSNRHIDHMPMHTSS